MNLCLDWHYKCCGCEQEFRVSDLVRRKEFDKIECMYCGSRELKDITTSYHKIDHETGQEICKKLSL